MARHGAAEGEYRSSAVIARRKTEIHGREGSATIIWSTGTRLKAALGSVDYSGQYVRIVAVNVCHNALTEYVWQY